MWNKIRGNPIFFVIGLVLTAFGGIHFTRTAIIPHLENLIGRL